MPTSEAPNATPEPIVTKTANAEVVSLSAHAEAGRRLSLEQAKFGLLAAAFSAQGSRFMPLEPLEHWTPKRNRPTLVLVRLPLITVPKEIRKDLAELPRDERGYRVVEVGQGALGGALRQLQVKRGIPVFGASPRDRVVRIPDHPEFNAGSVLAGGGIIGAGLSLPSAHAPGRPHLGCIVPLPEVSRGFGTDDDDRTVDFSEFRGLVRQRFQDEVLEAALDRLDALASGEMAAGPSPMAYDPNPRWFHQSTSPFVRIALGAPQPRWRF